MNTPNTQEVTVNDGGYLTITGRVVLRSEGYVVRYTVRDLEGPDCRKDLTRTQTFEVLEALEYGFVSARGLIYAATPSITKLGASGVEVVR